MVGTMSPRALLSPALWLAVMGPAGAFMVTLWGQAAKEDDNLWDQAPVLLSPLLVATGHDETDYDETGMGVLEAEWNEPPFSNSLLGVHWRQENELGEDLNAEMAQVAAVNPVELATGVGRTNLRGFPTPRLRNGFLQQGLPEVLDVQRTETIQGPLTQVTGRAAPGGIQNMMTARPRGNRVVGRVQTGVDTAGSRQGRFESTGPWVPRHTWYRVAGGWRRQDGPLDYAWRETRNWHGALTVRHSAAASTLVQVDYADLRANIAPAIPEYRPTAQAKVAGPYLPLADFNAAGPNAGVTKQVVSASLQHEAQRSRAFHYRISLQGFWRELEEDRWTLGQYVLNTGVFGGVRQPIRLEQPLHAAAAQVDGNWRLAWGGVEHRLLASVAHNRVDYERWQAGLLAADRDGLLPADVRRFDPEAPNYFRPPYDPEVFRRVINDRSEVTDYTTVFLSDRAAFAQGRVVTTVGARADWVGLEVEDRRPGAPFREVRDDTSQLTWHGGVNVLAIPNRLLVFSNLSTAFHPSTRVDARTGNLQGNATTRGLEVGLRGVAWDQRINFTALFYALRNQNISRRNPLYNDPIADVGLTQPELVAAGEEEFLGGTLDVRAKLSEAWTLNGRAGYTRATTTKSPDLSGEVGRALTRLPGQTLSLQTRYAFPEGRWRGLTLGGGLTHVGDYVQHYESASREYLAYPDYTLASVNAGYRWQEGRRTHVIGLTLRNALDRDLLATHVRVGAGRELGLNYALTF
jgi:iron complex outermembrane receptor protein